ncbi:bone marrow proteoglycan [Ctenodactylus gundi]
MTPCLLLTLLVGAACAAHLGRAKPWPAGLAGAVRGPGEASGDNGSSSRPGTRTPGLENALEDQVLPQTAEMPEEAPSGDLEVLAEDSEGQEGGSGSEDSREAEGALDVADKDFQCPKKENVKQLAGCPECPPHRYVLVREARTFQCAQRVCRHCFRGSLVSVHSLSFNSHLQCMARGLNQGQVWIGGCTVGWYFWRCFAWVDGSSWNFAYWAAGQPQASGGRCVTLCTQDGHWRSSHCAQQHPFICAY